MHSLTHCKLHPVDFRNHATAASRSQELTEHLQLQPPHVLSVIRRMGRLRDRWIQPSTITLQRPGVTRRLYVVHMQSHMYACRGTRSMEL